MTRPLRLGRIFGFAIEVDYTWFLVFALVAVSLASGYLPSKLPRIPAATRALAGGVATLLFFASVLAHEISHSLVARWQGLKISGITLFIFGGVAKLSEEPRSPRAEFLISAAGPLTSLLLAAVFLALHFFLQPFHELAGIVFRWLGLANGMLAIFNLAPGFPLDGGRLLRALLWRATGSLSRATRIASLAGQGLGIALIAFALLAFVGGDHVGGLWLAFIGWFLMQAAQGGYRQLLLRQALSNIKVSQIMTPQVAWLPAGITLEQLFSDYFLVLNFAAFPVLDRERVVGLLHLAHARAVPRERWPTATVGEIVPPLQPEQTISPWQDAWEALVRMMGGNQGRLLVMEEGRLQGILSRSDIMRVLRARLDLGP